MNKLQIQAALAGVFFGLWPLFMNRSKLEGNVSSAIFSLLVFIFVLPFALGRLKTLPEADWTMVVLAGIFGAIGVMCFNGMLSKASTSDVSMLFVIMILVQTAVTSAYYVIMNQGIHIYKMLGFVLAMVAAVLLTIKE